MTRMMIVAAVAAAATLGSAAGASAQVVQAGTLTCEVAGGTGFVVGSRKEVTCTFQNPVGELEIYDGAILKYGLDIGSTDEARIVWSVLAPSGARLRGALAGRYVGATAQASVGTGVGANVLVGGSGRSITLQPVSVSTQSGFNLAAGAADLTLRLRPNPGLSRVR